MTFARRCGGGRVMREGADNPVSAAEAAALFADLSGAPALILAVSGGPDSTALMWLAAQWRARRKHGPKLIAITVDHGLRKESVAEARDVKRLARSLELPHRTMRWTGAKPKTGLPAAARAARYDLLARAARAHGATHIFTAHTRDDQAETLLMRLMRGSGIAGLAAMARQSERNGLLLARPLLHVAKSQLVATLKKAGVGVADDPTNRDPNFTRPRIRAVMPALAAEGGDARNLARLASRLARANAAVEVLVDGAERYLALNLALRDREINHSGIGAKAVDAKTFDFRLFDFEAFAGMPEEIRLRLLLRAIERFGHEGPAELGKVEALLSALDGMVAENTVAHRPRLKRTLAGALVSLSDGRIRVEPAPPRRRRVD
jgi:tRNA(Ile)-lysidine synthase